MVTSTSNSTSSTGFIHNAFISDDGVSPLSLDKPDAVSRLSSADGPRSRPVSKRLSISAIGAAERSQDVILLTLSPAIACVFKPSGTRSMSMPLALCRLFSQITASCLFPHFFVILANRNASCLQQVCDCCFRLRSFGTRRALHRILQPLSHSLSNQNQFQESSRILMLWAACGYTPR